MKKTIIFTLDLFEYGGVTSFVHLYQNVALKRFNIIIIGRKGNISNPSNMFPNANVVEIQEPVRDSFYFRIIGFFTYLKTLHAIYQHNSIYAIHFSTPWSTFYALLHPQTWRIQRVITYYGADDLEVASRREAASTLSNKLGDLFRRRLQRIGLTTSNTIVTFSRYAKNQMIKHFSLSDHDIKKIMIIPGFIDTEPTAILKKPEQRLTIVNIGRAEPRKGINLLLQALFLLKEQGVPFKAYIASPVFYYKNTDLLDIYEKLNLFTDVHFIHPVWGKEKKELMKMADVFVMPSLDLETFGFTMIESLSCGIPVIGTPVGSIPEILQPIDRRLVVKSITARSFADSLIWLYKLSNKEKYSLQQKILQYVKNHYVQNIWKKNILSLYT